MLRSMYIIDMLIQISITTQKHNIYLFTIGMPAHENDSSSELCCYEPG